MPDFGVRFVNLSDDPRLSTVDPSGIDLAARLRATLGFPELREGPVTLYLSLPTRFRGELTLESRFSLLFGPAAFVAMARGSTWTVEGEVDLGILPRFAMEPDARVLLLGPIECLRPEWWGVGQFADGALAATIACAIARAEAGVSQVPIRLLGPYRLEQTLSIGPRPHDAEVALTFEGSHPRGDAELSPTFSRHPESRTRFPLWRINAGIILRVQGVAFDLRLPEAPDAEVLDFGGVVHAGVTSRLHYERCTFFSDRGTAVWVAARVDDGTRAAWHRGMVDRAVFSDCWFQLEERGARDGIGIKVAEEGPLRLRVDGCVFRGSAAGMIAFAGGMVEVVGCQFHNESRDGTAITKEPARKDGRVVNAGRFWPGPDLLIGALARDDTEVNTRAELAPLGLLMTHVQSRSPRLLCGVRTDATADSFVTLTGVVSRPEGAVEDLPASIFWRGACGGGIVVQGCDIRGALDVQFPGLEYVVSTASMLRAPSDVSNRAILRRP